MCIADVKKSLKESTRHSVRIAQQVKVLMQYEFERKNEIVKRAVIEKSADSLAYDNVTLTKKKNLERCNSFYFESELFEQQLFMLIIKITLDI